MITWLWLCRSRLAHAFRDSALALCGGVERQPGDIDWELLLPKHQKCFKCLKRAKARP